MSYQNIIITLIILILSGCNDQSNKPYLLKTNKSKITDKKPTDKHKKELSSTEMKLKLATVSYKHTEQLATIAAQKEKDLKQIALQQSRVENNTKLKIIESEQNSKIVIERERAKKESALEQERVKNAISLAREKTRRYQQYLIGGIVLVLAVLLVIFLIYRRAQILKLKLHEEELRHKEHMQESQQYHERINKTLEILSNESTDKNLKKDLVRLLKDQNVQQPKLLS